MNEILDITLHVTETLERLGVRYLVGGSLASSLHGIPRAPQAVDLVAPRARPRVRGFPRGRMNVEDLLARAWKEAGLKDY